MGIGRRVEKKSEKWRWEGRESETEREGRTRGKREPGKGRKVER